MRKFTRWFSITKHGQPHRAGWYSVRYESKAETELYFDGKVWRYRPGGDETVFGNEDTNGECWQGITEEYANFLAANN